MKYFVKTIKKTTHILILINSNNLSTISNTTSVSDGPSPHYQRERERCITSDIAQIILPDVCPTVEEKLHRLQNNMLPEVPVSWMQFKGPFTYLGSLGRGHTKKRRTFYISPRLCVNNFLNMHITHCFVVYLSYLCMSFYGTLSSRELRTGSKYFCHQMLL